MARDAATERGRISDAAVRNATGREWSEWFAALDTAGGERMSHKEIVAWLRDEAGLDNGWWQQSVTVEYKKARGRRAEVGETADAGFQVGAQRTLAAPADRVWELMVSPSARDVWLGEVGALPLEKGHRYRCRDGTQGEIRSVRHGERLRLSWQPPGWSRPSTLQVTVTARGGKCTVGFHHEKLPDLETRHAMAERWRSVLHRIEAMLDG